MSAVDVEALREKLGERGLCRESLNILGFVKYVEEDRDRIELHPGEVIAEFGSGGLGFLDDRFGTGKQDEYERVDGVVRFSRGEHQKVVEKMETLSEFLSRDFSGSESGRVVWFDRLSQVCKVCGGRKELSSRVYREKDGEEYLCQNNGCPMQGKRMAVLDS